MNAPLIVNIVASILLLLVYPAVLLAGIMGIASQHITFETKGLSVFLLQVLY